MNFAFAILTLLIVSFSAHADPLRVVTTLPDLAEVAKRIGGDAVQVTSLLSGREDAHHVDAVPDFIRKVADADVVCVMGLDLEVGWMPKVFTKSGNAKVQPGGKGYCNTGEGISVLEKPTGTIDRSMGDVHPGGNPHFNLSPKALKEAAVTIARVLKAQNPSEAGKVDANLKKFQADMDELHDRIAKRLKPAIDLSSRHAVVVDYHKELSYFVSAYGLKSFGSIEEKPGVPPSAARIATIATAAKQEGVKIALASVFAPEKQLARFREISGIGFRQVPTAVQTRGSGNKTIEDLQNTIADAILSAFADQVEHGAGARK